MQPVTLHQWHLLLNLLLVSRTLNVVEHGSQLGANAATVRLLTGVCSLHRVAACKHFLFTTPNDFLSAAMFLECSTCEMIRKFGNQHYCRTRKRQIQHECHSHNALFVQNFLCIKYGYLLILFAATCKENIYLFPNFPADRDQGQSRFVASNSRGAREEKQTTGNNK